MPMQGETPRIPSPMCSTSFEFRYNFQDKIFIFYPKLSVLTSPGCGRALRRAETRKLPGENRIFLAIVVHDQRQVDSMLILLLNFSKSQCNLNFPLRTTNATILIICSCLLSLYVHYTLQKKFPTLVPCKKNFPHLFPTTKNPNFANKLFFQGHGRR